jgi:hypothetical protein
MRVAPPGVQSQAIVSDAAVVASAGPKTLTGQAAADTLHLAAQVAADRKGGRVSTVRLAVAGSMYNFKNRQTGGFLFES